MTELVAPSLQEPEEEDLVPASSDEGLWQRSKRQKVNNFLVGFDEFCIRIFDTIRYIMPSLTICMMGFVLVWYMLIILIIMHL